MKYKNTWTGEDGEIDFSSTKQEGFEPTNHFVWVNRKPRMGDVRILTTHPDRSLMMAQKWVHENGKEIWMYIHHIQIEGQD